MTQRRNTDNFSNSIRAIQRAQLSSVQTPLDQIPDQEENTGQGVSILEHIVQNRVHITAVSDCTAEMLVFIAGDHS